LTENEVDFVFGGKNHRYYKPTESVVELYVTDTKE
jgi:hypothetical protein